MTGVDKIAVLFRVLGTEFAQPMSKQLRHEEVARIAEAMIRFENQPPTDAEIKAVLEEFRESMTAGGIFANVTETLQQLFYDKFGPQDGAKMLSEVRLMVQSESPFKGLQGIPMIDLERILSEEHPQVQAAVLSNIDPELAAGVIACMSEERRKHVVEKIATMTPPPPRLLKDLADLFIEKTRRLPRFQESIDATATSPSIRRVANVLNAAQSEIIKTVLESLQGDQPDLVEKIRETMFTFDDLAKVDKRSMQKILGGIDTKALAMALKSCSKEVVESIMGAVSARTKEIILEEKELLGAVTLTQVKEAQGEIMKTIRGLIDSGAVSVNAGGKGEKLVT